jgi:hypothetical protein
MRILYIAGSGRSGSTLVAGVLGQLDGFFSAGELRYLWQRGMLENRPCGCGLSFQDCPVWKSIVGELNVDPATIARGLRERLRIRRPATLRGRIPAHPDDGAIHALYTGIDRHTGGQIIVDSSKLPPYAALLRGLPGIELYVLHLVRDPRATAFSWRRRRGLDGDRDTQLMSRPPLGKAALLWLTWNTTAARLFADRPDRYLRLRYEDFVADPTGATRAIAAFVGAPAEHLPFLRGDTLTLAPTHSVAGNPSRHRTGTVRVVADDEWTRGLSASGFTLVTALTGVVLRRFGYPLRRPGSVGSPREV